MPVADLAALERGEKTPNLTFFKKLSARLRIPGGSLLRQEPPNVPPLPTDFRTVEGREPTVGFEVRLAVSYARTISENVRELAEEELTEPLPVLPRLRLGANPDEAGEAERARLNVSAVQQLGWGSNQAFRNWRTVVEGAGTFVLLKNFPLADCKGFTIYDHRSAPIIVISKKERLDVARTFTLLHEYAHLLLREPGLSDHDDRNPVEAFCNRFAAAFLMPRNIIREMLGGWPLEPQDWDMGDVRNWARQLKVSQQAMALRFERLGIAPAGYYNTFRERQGQAAAPREPNGGNYVATQVNELGDRFSYSVLQAEHGARIAPVEAADILDIRPAHFGNIRQQIENHRTRVGVG